MRRDLSWLLLAAFAITPPARACDCRAPKPPCAYIAADAIFLGRVSFTNDDNSGKFTQATLVRFEVEERFKGIAPEVRQIWVDPGSFTSCYERYTLGERYLVFGNRKDRLPNDTAAMTVMRSSDGRKKPIPPDFDSTTPPPVYYAPECGGSRPATYQSMDRDLAMLGDYRAGKLLPRVLGHVYLYPFFGWPLLTGPALQGARVKMDSGTNVLRATTDGNGDISLKDAPAGIYNAWAELPPYRMGPQVILHVPEIGCGYADIELTTTSTLQGIVLDHRGRPAPGIPVGVRAKDARLAKEMRYPPWTKTDESGQFAIRGLPDADLYLSAGSGSPTTKMPYKRVEYRSGDSHVGATVLRLRPGERRQGMVLWLEPPLEKTSVTVRVVDNHGQPAVNVGVFAFDDDDVISELARTGPNGTAELPCLRWWKYNLKAMMYLPTKHPISKTPFTCEGRGVRTVILEVPK